MSTPRNKRQFAGAAADPAQRQITSFFTTGNTTNNSSSNINNTPEPALRPVLPANVQANLLSVGMRVRKSVPEGYKTVTSSNNILVWNDGKSAGAKTFSAAVATTRRPVAKELLPFCGINKVGGMDTQPEHGYEYDDNDEDVPSLDQVPELSMSQESTDSVAESGLSRKRFLDEQDEDISFWDRDGGDVAGNNRAIAVPRSRMKKQQPAALKAVVDQENMVVDDDFEDANFLVYDSEKSMDMSV
ncbi:hypothetical protein MKX07_003369 [Trichoderma sp. CBMAI-0711]|uniref:Uncharacterized protein n=1 Tax=Trichoderma parareesei TaxID=858221 RepID=A0A2H2ZM20_TRIPA|nr:hypothetical protein MKX07_003369 [Trichoderma sp. CBMAI-0711]OTA08377.1 hypothetical protein A9Z42_0000570 [Trichoderma parareesei]